MAKAPPTPRTRSAVQRALQPVALLCFCAAVVSLGLQPGRSVASEAHDQATQFTLLTYNVHGLSPITSGGWWGVDRLDRMRRAFAPYQVVLLQEDFETRDDLAKGDPWDPHPGSGGSGGPGFRP